MSSGVLLGKCQIKYMEGRHLKGARMELGHVDVEVCRCELVGCKGVRVCEFTNACGVTGYGSILAASLCQYVVILLHTGTTMLYCLYKQ